MVIDVLEVNASFFIVITRFFYADIVFSNYFCCMLCVFVMWRHYMELWKVACYWVYIFYGGFNLL